MDSTADSSTRTEPDTAATDAGPTDAPSPAFQPGKAGFGTLVLAAPGLEEEAAKCPAAGRTGVNLDALLAAARARAPDIFPSADRRDYRIVNAVALVLHGKRTLPLKQEIEDPENIARLRRQLAESSTITAFGPDAACAVRAAGLEPTLCTGHPGLKGLNQLPVPPGTPLAEATRARLLLLASFLLGSRGRCQEAMLELAAVRATERARRRARKEAEIEAAHATRKRRPST